MSITTCYKFKAKNCERYMCNFDELYPCVEGPVNSVEIEKWRIREISPISSRLLCHVWLPCRKLHS